MLFLDGCVFACPKCGGLASIVPRRRADPTDFSTCRSEERSGSKGELCFTTPDYGGRVFSFPLLLSLATEPVSFAAGLFASVDETRVVQGFCASGCCHRHNFLEADVASTLRDCTSHEQGFAATLGSTGAMTSVLSTGTYRAKFSFSAHGGPAALPDGSRYFFGPE